MRILYLYRATFPNTKAFSVQVMNTCWALAAIGHQVVLVVDQLKGSPQEVLKYYGVEPLENLSLIEFHLRGDCLDNRLAFWKTKRRIRSLLRRFNPDEEWVFYVRQSYLLLLLRGMVGDQVSIFYEVHWLASLAYSERGGEDKAKEEMEKEAIFRATGVIFNSEGTRSMLEERVGKPMNERVIPNGTWIRYSQSSRDIELIYVGQLYPWKGVDYGVKILSFAKRLSLHVVGGNKERDIEAVRAQSKGVGVSERVILHGHQPPAIIPSFLLRSELGLVLSSPTDTEMRLLSSPIKLFEYMGHGVIPVARDVPYIRELIDEGQEGVLLRGDPKGDGEGIEALLRDEKWRQQLREACYVKAQEYTWDKRTCKIGSFIEEVLSGS
jgi:glycosyltransferase involved in cell wall biosynthesis